MLRCDWSADVCASDRYINHGCDANAESDIIDDRVWISATRSIKKGEEVLYNYNYDLVDALDNPCRCGAATCVGYIVHADYWPKLRKLVQKREIGRGACRDSVSSRGVPGPLEHTQLCIFSQKWPKFGLEFFLAILSLLFTYYPYNL